jgi:hypothetical protein
MIQLGMIGVWQMILIFIFLFIGVLPTILALVDVLKSEFKGNNKLIWVIVVLFGNFLGAVLYFLIGRSQKSK